MRRDGKKRVYLFYGEDDLSREEARELFLSKFIPQASCLNYDVYDAKDDVSDLIAVLGTLPLASPRRIVVIKNIDSLPEPRRKSLLEYVKAPPRHLLLVLDSGAGSLDGQFMKQLGASASAYFFRRSKGLDTARWVRERAARMGRPIAKDAANLLIESKGRDDLRTLAMELEKLALFAGTKKTISREDVALVSGRSVTATAFDVARAVTAKDRDKALSLLRGLAGAARHSAPETVIGALNWRFKLLWKGKRLLSLYRDRDRVLDELRIRPQEREVFLSQASAIRMSDLKLGFQLLVNADRAIKTGRPRHEAVLEQLVLRLCGA